MILRRIAVFVALACGILASQLPEFAQQYRQRLGGAIDEIQRMIAAFDADAARMSLSREQGLERLKTNSDALARRRGEHLEHDITRADRLERQLQSYDDAGPFGRLALFATQFDADIANRALDRFEPAVPVTAEGLASAGAGLAGGWVLARVLLAPFGRRKRRTAAKAG
jgi:Protein of unknown function (DUF2937)